jgi:hypothetical protein
MSSILNATTTTGLAISPDNSGSLQLATNNGTTAVTIDTSQNVGIGTATPAANPKVTIRQANNTTDGGLLITSADGTGAAGLARVNDGGMTFRNGGDERMRIDSSGRMLVGLTSWAGGATNAGVAIKATSTSSSIFAFYIDNTSSNILNVRCDGSTYNTTGVWGTISDQRLKENIVDATPKLDNLLQLKVRNFNFTNDENKTKQIGFVAQEIEQVFPSLVSEDAEGTKAVKTTVLLPMLVKAIQELKAIVDTQTTKIAELEAKLEGTE